MYGETEEQSEMVLYKDPLQTWHWKEHCRRRGTEDGPGCLSAAPAGEAAVGSVATGQDSLEEDIWILLLLWSCWAGLCFLLSSVLQAWTGESCLSSCADLMDL